MGTLAPPRAEASDLPGSSIVGDEAAWSRATRLGRWAVGLVVALVYWFPVWSVGLRTDLGAHLVIAEQMGLTGRTPPYSLFHQVTIAVRAFLPFEALALIDPSLAQRARTWEISGVVVIVASAVATALLVHARLLRWVPRRPSAPLWCAAVTVGLMVATPITVLTWPNEQMLAGYVPLTSYHNPTMMISRPFALVIFWLVADHLYGRAGRRATALAAVASALVVAGKPSYAVCLLPAVGLYVLWHRRRWPTVDRRFLALGLAGPMLLMVGFQAIRLDDLVGLQVAVAPFQVIENMLAGQGQAAWWFSLYALLSFVFPIAVALCCRRGEGSPAWPLAWLTVAIGIGYFCVFEITSFDDPGDFLWGAQVASLVLFVEAAVVSVRELWRVDVDPRWARPRRWIVGLAFALHVACGVAFAVAEVARPAAWW